jgi:hypothetical protein
MSEHASDYSVCYGLSCLSDIEEADHQRRLNLAVTMRLFTRVNVRSSMTSTFGLGCTGRVSPDVGSLA